MAEKKKICGIVMPISPSGDLDANHWIDVKSIIETACSEAGFEARLVSDTFESNLIHKEILQNIYEDDIIVVDVSARNPNVFFELGIRMATQKPTVIVKDNKTTYPFDTGPNRYIEYPRDLRHPEMEKFKGLLIEALEKTASHGPENSFIGQLGPFHIPEVESKETPISDLILERLDGLERRLNKTFTSGNLNSSRTPRKEPNFHGYVRGNIIELLVNGIDYDQLDRGTMDFLSRPTVQRRLKDWAIEVEGPEDYKVTITAHDYEWPKTHVSKLKEFILSA